MWVYLTRPPNYEIVSRGLDHVRLWVQEPAYSHEPDLHDTTVDIDGQELYFDKGWQAAYSSSTSAKFLIKQDLELTKKVMEHIWRAMLPSDMVIAPEKSVFDWLQEKDASPGSSLANVNKIEWENIDFAGQISYKRFLLAVNLISKETKILTPKVYATFGSLKSSWGVPSLAVPTEYQTSQRYPFPEDCEKFPF